MRSRAIFAALVFTLCALEALRIARDGVPLDRPTLLFAAVVACSLGAWRSRTSRIRDVVLDWLVLGLLLTAYDAGRGAATNIGIPVSYNLAPSVDYWLTGAVPTVWLQQHLYGHGLDRWWNVPFSLLYISHFFVPIITLTTLRIRSRERFRQYLQRFVLLTAGALLFYVLHPTAPPWLVSQRGGILPIFRTTGWGFAQLHLHVATTILNTGFRTSNVVAAFPSLHAAYPMLLLLILWPTARITTRIVTVVYVLAMAFMLVATGEHWVIDILAGWLLATAIALGCSWGENARARRL